MHYPEIFPVPSCVRRIAFSALLAAAAGPAASASVKLTFDTDLGPVDQLEQYAGAHAEWSPKFGGVMAITNEQDWTWSAELGIYNGAWLQEMRDCMRYGGVLEFDLLVDAESLGDGGSISPTLSATGGNGAEWDQEVNLPRINARDVAKKVVVTRISRGIKADMPFIPNDGALHFTAVNDHFRIGFGRSNSYGRTTYYVDNLTLKANRPVPAPEPVAASQFSATASSANGETINFAADAHGFAALSWEPGISIAHDPELGGVLRALVPPVSGAKNFWWLCRTGMDDKFGARFNAAIHQGGTFSFDVIGYAGTLVGNTPMVFAEQRLGKKTWSQAECPSIQDTDVFPLAGGFEKATVSLPFSAFSFEKDHPYTVLGFGLSRMDSQSSLVLYIDNITVSP